MNFTDSTTRLVDHELTCSGDDSYSEHGAYYNSAVPMDDSMDSNSTSSSADSPNFSADSFVYLRSSRPQFPSASPQDCSHWRQQQHLQQQQQQQHSQGSQRPWRNFTPESEEVTFSHRDLNGLSDFGQNLKQHQRQQQQQQQQQQSQQRQQQQRQQQQQQPQQQCQQLQQQQEQQHHLQQQQQQNTHDPEEDAAGPQRCGCGGGGGGDGGGGGGGGRQAEVMFFHSARGLWDSLAYITSLTDMCDVVFHVGKTRQPVYGVKSLLSVRSRVMYLKILQAQRSITPISSKNSWRSLRHRRDDVTKDSRIHIDVLDYDVTVFSQLITFLHSGRVTVDEETVLGLYCAAAEHEVADLRRACWDFVERCVERNQTHSVLASGRPYLGRRCLHKLRRQFFKS